MRPADPIDRGLVRLVTAMRVVTLSALVGAMVWVARTPAMSSMLRDTFDALLRDPAEPLAETLAVLGGEPGAEARAASGDGRAACQVAVARALGERCGRPVGRRHAARFAALVGACERDWPKDAVACLALPGAADRAACARAVPLACRY